MRRELIPQGGDLIKQMVNNRNHTQFREDEELRRYGAAQAKKLGIKSKDIDRLIHEYRQERRNAGRS